MRTTINSVDRRGDAHAIEHLEDVLIEARRILADSRAALELEFDELKSGELDKKGELRLENINKALAAARKSTQLVLDLEAKLCVYSLSNGSAIDLEAARHEILGRLDRLAS